MGGGSSSLQVEEMLTATYMIGRAIASISFPGMYKIYDFHSSKAPKIRNIKNVTLFSSYPSDDDDDDDDEDEIPDPSAYSHFFHVKIGEDVVYIENPIEANSTGWTPLHTCCLSFLTVDAGMALIDETLRLGGNLDIKTKIGPGNFNAGWTPLHMACAYGVEPLVLRLVQAGADVNCTNSHGYSPLLESCHRGFTNIVSTLIANGAIIDYVPIDERSSDSPFTKAPAQSPLGEASRCGFLRIVQILIDSGANKDLQNNLGWTSLHESCFYNRIEVVKYLMLNGANPALRTNSQALPYHFAGLQIIRSMLRDMGGEEAVPDESDTIDMADIMRELTSNDNSSASSTSKPSSSSKPMELANQSQQKAIASPSSQSKLSSSSSTSATASASSTQSPSKSNSKSPSKQNTSVSFGTTTTTAAAPESPKVELLHSGPMLGNLPSLSAKKSPSSSSSQTISSPPKKLKQKMLVPPKDTPTEFICELCQKLMSDPVRSVYGNVFDRPVIEAWIQKQGHICPLTGAPLTDSDLQSDNDLRAKISKWILQKGTQSRDQTSLSPTSSGRGEEGGGDALEGSPTVNSNTNSKKQKKSKSMAPSTEEDDLYDF